MKTLDDVHQLPGMLSVAEVECLFRLGRFNGATGLTVEIGSWKGKSTVALGLGAATVHNDKIYAIDDTEAEFLANIRRSGVDAQVIPMIMTSEEAARGWNKPIRLL